MKRIFCVTIELMASCRVSFDQEGAFDRHCTSDSLHFQNKKKMREKMKNKNENQKHKSIKINEMLHEKKSVSINR